MKQNKETLKKYFETGDKPTQQQYAELIDSYIDSKQPEGEANRRFVIDETGEVSVAPEKKAQEYNLQQVSDNGSKTTNKLTVENSFDATGKLDLSHNEVGMLNSRQSTFLLQQRVAMLDEQSKLNFDVNNGSFTSTHQKTDGSSSLNLAFPTEELKQETTSSSKVLKLPNKAGTIATLDDVSQIQAGTNITIDKTDPQRPIINATGSSGGGSTNLSYNASTRTLASSSGTDVVIPVADATNAGLMKANFYEEGTFTPVLVTGNSLDDNSKKYSTVSPRGNFVRIGNMVDFWISFRNVSNPTDGVLGALTIGGIPFNAEYGDQRLSSVNITRLAFSNAANSQNSNNPYSTTTPSIIRGSYGAINGTITFSDVFGFPLQNVSFNDDTSGVDIIISGRFKTNVYTP
ncbi:hypothetical protein F7018_00280 [Tenacibaculum aiptasiae]|uniref:Uncharacterized protein n=1 Tax=Tenacibaculum aiptasiae TaxID=426481 RepID=A0A7J5ARV2_9FLAO|nr:hypothetical protein [Tenacibaculum aiptasiae]KAB1160348.1 hypothetical protein F7018_00280 [Tenacibaculum aiptasiae]